MGEVKVNLIDTPGFTDFFGKVRAALPGADLAVVVVSAVEGIEAQSEALWDLAAELDRQPILDEPAEVEHQEREQLVEGIVVGDDTLMERYLDGEMPTAEDLKATLATGGRHPQAVHPRRRKGSGRGHIRRWTARVPRRGPGDHLPRRPVPHPSSPESRASAP